jgi:hypothetical protein
MVIKSKLSLYRPLGSQKVEAARTAKQSANESGNVVSPTHWLSLPPKRYLWYLFLLGLSYHLHLSVVRRFEVIGWYFI